jgi:hypothetical protein
MARCAHGKGKYGSFFRAVPEKQTTSPPFLRAKEAKKALRRISTKRLQKFIISEPQFA